MADGPKNLAASVKQRLLNMARDQNRAFDILLVRFALERLLFRLSLSAYRDNYVLKGGMLVTQWLEHGNRETRDMDFLGFGEADAEAIKAIFAEIMTIASDDGLEFDTEALTASAICEEMEYGGIRLRTTAYLERTRIPVRWLVGASPRRRACGIERSAALPVGANSLRFPQTPFAQLGGSICRQVL